MSDPLVTYLQDHLAGSEHAAELIEDLRDQYAGDPIGEFASKLLVEVETDRATLKRLIEHLGGGSTAFKEFTGWLSDKVSRVKLRLTSDRELGTFESLEFLVLGIHGKRGLWRALQTASAHDSRLSILDFEDLIARAEEQEARAEKERLQIVRSALLPSQNSAA